MAGAPPTTSRARDLSVKLGRAVSPPILRGMAMNSILRLELADAREHGLALLAAGERDDDPVLIVEGDTSWASPRSGRAGSGSLADTWRRRSTGTRPSAARRTSPLYSQDPKVVCLSRLAWTLWFLGYPDEAAEARDAAAVARRRARVTRSAAATRVSTARSSATSSATSRRERGWSQPPRRSRPTRSSTSCGDGPRSSPHAALALRGDRGALAAMGTAISGFEQRGQRLLMAYFRSLLGRA